MPNITFGKLSQRKLHIWEVVTHGNLEVSLGKGRWEITLQPHILISLQAKSIHIIVHTHRVGIRL